MTKITVEEESACKFHIDKQHSMRIVDSYINAHTRGVFFKLLNPRMYKWLENTDELSRMKLV